MEDVYDEPMDAAQRKLRQDTRDVIRHVFENLNYSALGAIYCDEGGEAFWEERRGPAEELGTRLAEILLSRLPVRGRSLVVGAGVAELPVLIMEHMELGREIAAFNLRATEVEVLNQACRALPFRIEANDAGTASGSFDHLSIVSVLNDPECFPQLGALSSGRANPVTFDLQAFAMERLAVFTLADGCLAKLCRPGLITTSIEEICWITDWCDRNKIACVVEDEDYPTAIVQDPVCFIRLD